MSAWTKIKRFFCEEKPSLIDELHTIINETESHIKKAKKDAARVTSRVKKESAAVKKPRVSEKSKSHVSLD